MSSKPLTIALDIGHSSIGWAVLSDKPKTDPDLIAAGTVLFDNTTCMAKARRDHRRQRRHIAATRHRVQVLRRLLLQMGVMTEAELDAVQPSSPWLTAAKILTQGADAAVDWPELWNVLRWYAHNRGYDGNRLWAKGDDSEEDKDDQKRVQEANAQMERCGTETMAETVCKVLGIYPSSSKCSSACPEEGFKSLGLAFPRKIVEEEVQQILECHKGHLPGCDDSFIEAIMEEAKKLPLKTDPLPKRFRGGYLFGQMMPRFDNRIINRCLISGDKVPSKHCREYYRYRWAMLLDNFRVEDPKAETGERPLSAEERRQVHEQMEAAGFLDKRSLKKAIEAASGLKAPQLDRYFLNSEMEQALVFHPALKVLHTAKATELYEMLNEKQQKIFLGKLNKGQKTTQAFVRTALAESLGDKEKAQKIIDEGFQAWFKSKRKKDTASDVDAWLGIIRQKALQAIPSGRAPYSKKIMAQAAEEVFAGRDPRSEEGCLKGASEPDLNIPIDHLTNNHLIRHRLLILTKLLDDIVDSFANGDKTQIARVVVEVVRDLAEFSGLDAQEKKTKIEAGLKQHKLAEAYLEEKRDKLHLDFNQGYPITGSLIRKVRIANDMGWKCPYTGHDYNLASILQGKLEIEHIIPRSQRHSDSLDSLVLTWPAVNKMKGNQTAYSFVRENQGKPVPGIEGKYITTKDHYERFVQSLKPDSNFRAPFSVQSLEQTTPSMVFCKADKSRKLKRIHHLLTPSFDPRKKDFVPGDLTQTAWLNRLASRVVRKHFKDSPHQPSVDSIPGSVTGVVRKHWKLMGCLADTYPEVLDPEGNLWHKEEIRQRNHLHHAVDAITLGLKATLIPRDGEVWRLLVKRRLKPEERATLEKKAPHLCRFTEKDSFDLVPLPKPLLKRVTAVLAERRVAFHLPKKKHGLKVTQNTYGICDYEVETEGQYEGKVALHRDGKPTWEKPQKLHGYTPKEEVGKLSKLKGALVVEENYGVALLEPKTEGKLTRNDAKVIPFARVWQQLGELKALNRGIMPTVLRKGSLIEVEKGPNKGRWRIFQIKDQTIAGPQLVIGEPQNVDLKKLNLLKPKSLLPLRKNGLRLLEKNLTLS